MASRASQPDYRFNTSISQTTGGFVQDGLRRVDSDTINRVDTETVNTATPDNSEPTGNPNVPADTNMRPDPNRRLRLDLPKIKNTPVRSLKSARDYNDKNYKGYDAVKGKPDKPERVRCKERPEDNRPKGGGGGGGRKFVPWKGTKYGC